MAHQHGTEINLRGDMAAPFLKKKVGERVNVTVSGIIYEIGERPESEITPATSKQTKEKLVPRVTIYATSINSEEEGGEEDIEKEISEAKRNTHERLREKEGDY